MGREESAVLLFLTETVPTQRHSPKRQRGQARPHLCFGLLEERWLVRSFYLIR